MRIRRFAGTILGTGHYNPSRSPDLYASPPPFPPSSNDIQLMQKSMRGVKIRGNERMPVVTKTATESIDNELSDQMEDEKDRSDQLGAEYGSNQDQGVITCRQLFDHQAKEHDSNPNMFSSLLIDGIPKGKRTKRKGRTELESNTRTLIESKTPLICRKTDGKNWRCSRLAHHPTTFCKYHLQRKRINNKNFRSAAAAVGRSNRTRKKRVCRPVAASAETDLGTWRGKQRVGGGNALDRSVAAVAAEEKLDSAQESRKVIKYRSLKSLMSSFNGQPSF